MFFRRREVMLPTLWGWLVLLLVMAALGATFLINANAFLSRSEAARGADGQGARTLIVEGWLDPAELAQAVEAYRRGRYERVLTTGGPIDPWIDVGGFGNFALRAAEYLRAHGLANASVTALPAPQTRKDRTYLSAAMVRDWAQRSGLKLEAVDVFSADVHARRSRLVFGMALGSDVEVGVLAATPNDYDIERWWTSSAGAKATLGELLSLAWTHCCFWPDAAGLQAPLPAAASSPSAPASGAPAAASSAPG